MQRIDEVLRFWFEEIEPAMWWKKDAGFDRLVVERFLPLYRSAAQCELFGWRSNPRGRLAEVIVLDQFPRNMFRGRPESFASDPLALALAQAAVEQGADRPLSPVERSFLCMPYMHSESAAVHAVGIGLFEAIGLAGNLDAAQRHRAIIERFGRYPHRNSILGRASTAEEIEFLEQPGSSF